MAIELTDDGTLDTVLRCSECGEEMRYNYDPSQNDERVAELTEEYTRQATTGIGIYSLPNVENRVNETLYDEFVEWAIEDATDSHECPNDPDAEPTEPQENDITTEDHETFYQYGRKVLVLEHPRTSPAGWYYMPTRGGSWTLLDIPEEDMKAAIRAYMERTQFWPNCWFISDHGNAHLMDLSEDK